MSYDLKCTSCGLQNVDGALECAGCNFPLRPPGADVPRPAVPVAAVEREPVITLRKPVRRVRANPALNQTSVMLWLLFGVFGAAVLIFTAIKANVDRARPPVEGTNREQQQQIDVLRTRVEADSNNVDARVALANLYYDTANWQDAIIHYRAAVRRDSSRVAALVDLGVSYYNLGNSLEAERHFQLGLARDPHQPIALFNLGIVHERRADYDASIEYFHRALIDQPSEDIRQGVMAAMQRIQEKTGRAPKPLPQGQAGDSTHQH